MSPSFQATPVALCLGGVDPSGGAGLLRDALTVAEFGVHPMIVGTAETVQNSLGCQRISSPSVNPLERLLSLAPHLQGTWGVKVGMCCLELEALAPLVDELERHAPKVRIWDPILAPTLGVELHQPVTLKGFARVLLAHPGWVVCPNIPEAEAFAALKPGTAPRELAAPWLELGAQAVWLKGGHGAGEPEDFWIEADGVHGLGKATRLPGERRGTGCTLASAWLAMRLLGQGPQEAAQQAAAWLRARWERAFTPGHQGRPIFAPEGV